MKRWIVFAVSGIALLVVTSRAGAADMEAAKKKVAEVCAACHGADGNSTNPIYPRLAGQHGDYLAKALQDYKSGARQNPIMQAMAAGLSDQDIANLAAYFASQKGLVQRPARATE